MSNNPQEQDKPISDAFPTQEVSEDFDASKLGFERELETHPAQAPASKQTVRIYLASHTEPLIFENVEKLVLGRGDEESKPDLDLSPYYASMLGVSRLHAEIAFERGIYYLKDLNSSNGTWLNMRKLESDERLPMESSNQVRLAHLLMLISIE